MQNAPYKTVLLLAALGSTAPAWAALTGVTGDAAIRPQADVRYDVTENDAGIRGMDEIANTTASATPDYGVPVVSNQVFFACHLLHFDPVNEPTTVTGGFKFDREIIGVITESSTLFDWDAICDDGGGMVYPSPLPFTAMFRGLESTQADAFTVSQGPGGHWNRIEVTAEVTDHIDQVRVITCLDTAGIASTCSMLADSVGWDTL